MSNHHRKVKTTLSTDRCVPCVTSSPSVTPLPVTPASPHVVETSLTSTFDDGLCVTVDVGLLFFLHDVVQTYIKENETTSSGACLKNYLLFVCGVEVGRFEFHHMCLCMVHTMRVPNRPFTVVCSLTWPLNGSETAGELVLIKTSLPLLCRSSCSYANYSTFK